MVSVDSLYLGTCVAILGQCLTSPSQRAEEYQQLENVVTLWCPRSLFHEHVVFCTCYLYLEKGGGETPNLTLYISLKRSVSCGHRVKSLIAPRARCGSFYCCYLLGGVGIKRGLGGL